MKKKIMIFSLLALALFVVAPFASAGSPVTEQPLTQEITVDQYGDSRTVAPSGLFRTAYLVVFVLTFTPGSGVQPCQGAEVRVRSLFHSYNGTTDDKGLHLFAVHTSFLREKTYFVSVKMTIGDHVAKRTAFLHFRSWQIDYKTFLFLQPSAS
jgi:hypothetical protein